MADIPVTRETLETAEKLGECAAEQGLTLDDNPYTAGELREAWIMGVVNHRPAGSKQESTMTPTFWENAGYGDQRLIARTTGRSTETRMSTSDPANLGKPILAPRGHIVLSEEGASGSVSFEAVDEAPPPQPPEPTLPPPQERGQQQR